MNLPVQYLERRSSLGAEWVSNYWEVHGTFPHQHEQVLPAAEIVLLVNLGAPHILWSGGVGRTCTDAWVSGLQQGPLLTQSVGPTDIWGVRLTLPGAHALFGSIAELRNEVIDLADVIGTDGSRLAHAIRDATEFEDRCRIFDAYLARMVVQARVWRPEVLWAMQRLREPGSALVQELALDIGWSRKHLYTQFMSHIGMSPKSLSRLIRFETALKIMGPHAGVNLVDTAIASGYYDQAQFTREFRGFAGMTPAYYLRQRVAQAEYGFAVAQR